MNLSRVISWLAGHWEKILFYSGLLGLALLLRSFHLDLQNFSDMVREDTQFLEQRQRPLTLIEERWVQGLIQKVQNAQGFIQKLPRDLFSVVRAEEKLPSTQDTGKAVEGADAASRFSLVKIYRQPVRLLFKGYLKLPDGRYSLQINWAGQTDFKREGESIRGYRIEKFEKVMGSVEIQRGYFREQDNSYVVIRKEPDPPVTLEKGKLVTEKELFAKLFDTQTNGLLTVYVGSPLGAYKVLDITEDEVLLSDQANQEIRLKRR